MNVRAAIAYAGRGIARPRYHANDSSGDILDIVPIDMHIADARARGSALDDAGFTLVAHRSAVTDFGDREAVNAVHRPEIVELIGELSGARSRCGGQPPASFAFSEKSRNRVPWTIRGRRALRMWISAMQLPRPSHTAPRPLTPSSRASSTSTSGAPFSAPPQDVPLAVCDARSITANDLIKADAVFDTPGQPEWSFEGIVVAHHPAHRWHWFPDMTLGEALIFKTHDSDPARAHCVPHVAFDNPSCGPETAPRRQHRNARHRPLVWLTSACQTPPPRAS